LGKYNTAVKINLNYFNKYNITANNIDNDIIDLYVTGYNFPNNTGIMIRITGVKV
jgi:hypothetical protein